LLPNEEDVDEKDDEKVELGDIDEVEHEEKEEDDGIVDEKVRGGMAVDRGVGG